MLRRNSVLLIFVRIFVVKILPNLYPCQISAYTSLAVGLLCYKMMIERPEINTNHCLTDTIVYSETC